MSEVLLEVTRGSLVENIVRGSIAVIGTDNTLIAHAGDPDYYTYMRSTAKPLQASVAVESGALDFFGISQEELAVMCSSHMGEDYHVAALESILCKIGLHESDLTLGEALSLSDEIYIKRIAEHIKPRKLYNNCSGKHCCMLTMCRYKGWDYSAYQKPDHPVQQIILATVAQYAQMDTKDITIGVDGCGVPVFAMPLRNMAIAYHNLAVPEKLDDIKKKAAARLVSAMTDYPHMVSGNGTFTTELMRATKGKVVAKLGADGVYCAAVPQMDIAVALKIEDGNGNMLAPAMMRALSQLNVFTQQEAKDLAHFAVLDNINCQNDKVGETKAVFELKAD